MPIWYPPANAADPAFAGAFVALAGSYAAATTDVVTADVTGDTVDRFVVNADGKIEWGPGNAALDSNLYRSAANVLKTDDSMVIVGLLEVQNAAGMMTNAVDTFSGSELLLMTGGSTRMKVRGDQIAFLQPIRANGQDPAGIPLTVKAEAAHTANLTEWQSSAAAVLASVSAAGRGLFAGLSITDATNIALGTTTGTKIGTATTQKLAFYNSTPIVKQTGVAVTAAGVHAALVNLGLIAA